MVVVARPASRSSALLCNSVRQCCLTSSVRPVSPAKKGSTWAQTLAAVPKQVLAVTSARTQA